MSTMSLRQIQEALQNPRGVMLIEGSQDAQTFDFVAPPLSAREMSQQAPAGEVREHLQAFIKPVKGGAGQMMGAARTQPHPSLQTQATKPASSQAAQFRPG